MEPSRRRGPSTNAWGEPLVDPQFVAHQGKLVLLARRKDARTDTLFYNVFQSTAAAGTDFADWSGWYEFTFPEAPLPTVANVRIEAARPAPEVRVGAMGLLTVRPDVARVDPADAGLAVASDDEYLYVVRVARSGALYLNRLQLIESEQESETDGGQTNQQTRDYQLAPAWEIRYRRSQLKDVPDGDNDTQGYTNLDGEPFFEPTIELPGIRTDVRMGVAIARVPTDDSQVAFWYIATRQADAVRLFRLDQTSGALTDFVAEPTAYDEIRPQLAGGEVPLSLLDFAPGLSFYAEQEPVQSSTDGEVGLQRAGRVLLTIPVGGGPTSALESALATYDFEVAADGAIPDLPAAEQAAPLVDGRIVDGKFEAADEPEYPTAADVASTIHVVDGKVVTSMILGQVKPHSDVRSMSGADGIVHVYYGGPPPQPGEITSVWSALEPGIPQMMVAQFDARSSRAMYTLDWRTPGAAAPPQTGVVELAAIATGPLLAGVQIEVSTTEPQSLRRTVTIRYPVDAAVADERWTGVPATLDQFIDVVDGASSSDLGDPNVRNGSTTFFDVSGQRPIIEVPLEVASSANPAHAQFVSTRPDLALTSVTAARVGTLSTISFTYASSGRVVATSIWGYVPDDARAYHDVFSGAASPNTYSYPSDPGSTALFALATNSDYDATPLIIHPGPDASLDASTTFEITVQGTRCTLAITLRDTDPVVIADLPRPAAEFAEALRAAEAFTSLGLEVSVGYATGDIVARRADVGPMSLAETASLAVLVMRVPETDAALAPGSYTARRDGHARLDGSQGWFDPTRMGGLTVVAVERPTSGEIATIEDTPVDGAPEAATRRLGDEAVGAPTSGSWKRRPATWALTFDPTTPGRESMDVPLGPAAVRLAPQFDWTFEAWVRPAGGGLQRVVSFVGPDNADVAVPPSYFLDLKGRKTLEFGSYDANPNTTSAFFQTTVTAAATFQPAANFTWECWIKPTVADPTLGSADFAGLVQVYDPEFPDLEPIFRIGLDAQRRIVFRSSSDGTDQHDIVSTVALAFGQGDASVWSHIAVVGRKSGDDWSIELALNGRPVGPNAATARFWDDPEATPVMAIGNEAYGSNAALVRLAHLRYWKLARTPAELRRTWFMTLTGEEPGLLGSWPIATDRGPGPTPAVFENTVAATGPAWNADYIPGTQPYVMVDDDFFMSMVASVAGADPEEGSALLATDRWNHVAMTYAAGGGVQLNPPSSFDTGRLDSVVVGDSSSLNPGQEMTIDAWIVVPQAPAVSGTIISRWGTDELDRSYEFSVGPDGRLSARLYVQSSLDDDYTVIGAGLTNLPFVADGKPYHVALTYRTFTETATGQSTPGSDFEPPVARWELNLYCYDPATGTRTASVMSGNNRIVGVPFALVRSSATPTVIGRSSVAQPGGPVQSVERMRFFHGTIGRTRLWRSQLTVAELFPDPTLRGGAPVRPRGLVSDWMFRDQTGTTALDDVGSNDGRLSSTALWTVFAANSQITFFANGAEVSARERFTGDPGPIERQFRLGAPADSAGVRGLSGQIDSVRIWDVTRSPDDLRDSAHTELGGAEADLVAFWSFADRAGTDETGGGNNGVGLTDDRFTASTAPVDNEGPVVRNVYGGARTEFNESVPGRPAVGEGAVLRLSPLGADAAALVRHYVLDPTQSLAPAARIGELDLVYLGQQQSDPTLIGYIEGAPPLPSENLTRPASGSGAYAQYRDASTVALTQTADVKLAFSNKSRSASDFSLSLGLGTYFRVKVNAGFFGAQWENFYADFTALAQTKHTLKWGNDRGVGYGAAWTNRQTDSLGVRGDYEPAGDVLNEQVGRRWVPDNVGYALVESMTADRYVAILRRTKTMVSTMLVPNLDIPPDRNIITFPIEPTYTKNGTLDGKVGLVSDPSFENADLVRGSYFKPTEAYAYRQQVEQSNLRLKAYYDQREVMASGSAGTIGLGDVPAQLPVDFDVEPLDVGQLAIARQGIVNSYVWTAAGGLHAEAQQFTGSSTHSYSGFRNYTWLLGANAVGRMPFFTGKLDIMGGTTLDVSLTKSDVLSQGFGLDVKVGGETNLRRWDDDEYEPFDAPGKVRGYRFMSIYLPPTTDNARQFSRVVDAKWIGTSSDPFAIALRGMRPSHAVWRVLHRVTFVDRVPPRLAASPLLSGDDERRRPVNLVGNAPLLELIEVNRPPGPPTPVNLATSIAVVMNPVAVDGVYPQAALAGLIPWWEDFLGRARSGADEAARAALERLVAEVTDYVVAGYVTQVLPLKR